MKKAGRNRLLLFGLCVSLGLITAGCGKHADNIDASDSGEFQVSEETLDKLSEDDSAESIEGITGKAANGETVADGETAADGESVAEAQSDESEIVNMTVYNYSSMDNVLAALICAMKEEGLSRVSTDWPVQKLAPRYLYSYVNLFDQDTFETVKKKGTAHNTYVKVDQEYLEELLMYAFGEKLSLEDMEADGDLVLKDGKSYYVAVGDVNPMMVDYTGYDNAGFTEFTVYSFDYEMALEDGDTEDGFVQVKFQEYPEMEAGIILKAVAVVQY